jgi:diguanylate cyclase (GGDEF)-like protein
MRRKSAPQAPDGESGRDSRLKLILLAVALVLVAGYAAWVTDMLDMVLNGIAGLMSAELPILPVAATVAAALIILLALFAARRRSSGRSKRRSGEARQPGAALAGRRQFIEELSGQIDAHAKSGRQVAIHLIDIDRFRAMNETLGEAEGDNFLRMVTERLLVLVNHPERLARIGDDEFAIIQPEVGGARHAEIYARRIQETMKDVCAEVPRHARPGASLGVAVYPEHGEDAVKILNCAALALHAAKNAGGETFRVFSRDIATAVDARLEMEKAISDGLHEGWFELHYQPQYDLALRRLAGFEALVRMKHPELGALLPARFLPIAEESGLIQPLGDWIIREAISTAGQWPAHLNLAINLSVGQFQHDDVAATILGAAEKHGVSPSRLQVELSEAILQDESGAVEEQLQQLRGSGVTVILDDFGISRSRLRALSEMSLDAVKLDTTLIDRVGADPEVDKLVRSLIGAAQSFHLDVLAEGVERAEQAHFLMSNECANVQGFLFGRPAPATEVAAIIAKDMRKTAGQPEDSAAPSRSVA